MLAIWIQETKRTTHKQKKEEDTLLRETSTLNKAIQMRCIEIRHNFCRLFLFELRAEMMENVSEWREYKRRKLMGEHLMKTLTPSFAHLFAVLSFCCPSYLLVVSRAHSDAWASTICSLVEDKCRTLSNRIIMLAALNESINFTIKNSFEFNQNADFGSAFDDCVEGSIEDWPRIIFHFIAILWCFFSCSDAN